MDTTLGLARNSKKAVVTGDYKIHRKMADENRELNHSGQMMQGLHNHGKEYGFYS